MGRILFNLLMISCTIIPNCVADTVWIDTFETPGSPGSDLEWISPWPLWTSEGLSYYLGTTETWNEDAYMCGSACTSESDSSEYSAFGNLYVPGTGGAITGMVMTGISFGSNGGYIGAFDFENDMVVLRDFDEVSGNMFVGIAAFELETDTWYAYRQEADLSRDLPWVRLKLWESGGTEPVYWTVEGYGAIDHPGEHLIIYGMDVTDSGQIRFDDVGVERQIAPRAAGEFSCSVTRGDIEISFEFPENADSMSLYGGTDPFFGLVPGSETTGITTVPITISGVAGDPVNNHYFVARGVNENGEGLPSLRIGEFDFNLDVP